ncbi:heme ABC transporter ATP-binding protein [Aeromicrobium sp. CF4.19]|uniref:heme ABC transporter ATP-binding protein n=1 Tax=Aeromicrobium sp. CF4.19 TaxID=3373082 RepID=UPI003EE48A9F
MITVEGVCVELGGVRILSDVDLTVPRGTLLALVGPNGAGKSTVLSVLAGDIAPSTGRVDIDGHSVASQSPRALARRRSVMLQEQRLAFGFRTVDVVRMGRAPWAGTEAEDRDDDVVADAVARAELGDLVERTFPTLSGGEKARTAFARALAQQAPVLLLDEPTAAMDLRHQESLLREARRLTHEGHTVVVVLHDLGLAAAHADRICLLDQGRVVADGAPRHVLTPERLTTVYRHRVDVVEVAGSLVVVPDRSVDALAPHRPPEEDSPCAPVS